MARTFFHFLTIYRGTAAKIANKVQNFAICLINPPKMDQAYSSFAKVYFLAVLFTLIITIDIYLEKLTACLSLYVVNFLS